MQMEGREAENGEIERLAELKAKRKVEGWEQFKSPWPFLPGLLGTVGLITLPILWMGVSNGEINLGLAVLVTIVVGILGWFFYRRHKAWEQVQFRKLHEEELL